MKNKKSGFTLVEIMVAVAIIMVLLTIAVPGFLRLRVIANENTALANCRAISSACQLYHVNKETYPGSLSSMIEPESNPPYIDTILATGRKQGYEFIYNLTDADHFILNANPLSAGLLKGRYFYMDETGIIRAKADGPAGPNDKIVF